MACNPWNSLPKNLLENQEFQNNVKSLLATVRLRDALVVPTEQRMKTFWVEKIKPGETCTQCTAENIKGVKGVVPRCTICQPRMQFIMGQAGKHGKVKAQINWSNSDPRLWNTHYWEVAKCYLGPGQKESSGPEATDCSNIITLWLNCLIFASLVAKIELLEKVRDSRNKLMHNPDMKLSADEMNAVFENIEGLLKDEKLATNPDANSQAVISELELMRNKTSAMFSELKGDFLDDLMKQSLRAEVADTYLTHYTKLQPLPWANITLPISLVYQKQTLQGREDDWRMHNRSSELKSIFESFGDEQCSPRRILIEGPPGMGKSTLCQRLIQAWARRVNASSTKSVSQHKEASQDDLEESSLHDFHIVFLIRVRDLIGGDLMDNLQENLVRSSWKDKDLEERLKRCININIEQVLLIVDGYDEGDEAQRRWVDSCLRGLDYRGCTLIVTSRPGFYRPTAQPEQNPDRTYTLMGLDNAKQQGFTSKFDQTMGVRPGQRSASEQLQQFQNKDFLKTPLLLAFICVLARQGQGALPRTVTGLYNEFTELMSLKAMSDPTKFKEEEVSKLLNLLQEIAFKLFRQKKSDITLDLVKEHVIKSEIEETMTNFCKLGLVQQEIKLKGWRNSQIGTFIHQSFQDFFSAKHFVSLIKEHEEERSPFLKDIEIQENMLVLAAGLCGESEEHRECFDQMLGAWDRAMQKELREPDKYDWYRIENHPVFHACLLWLSELRDPCWLHADHITTIYQSNNKGTDGEGICLHGDCTASCLRGVTALLEAAEHHRLHGSHHAPLDSATFHLTMITTFTIDPISTTAQLDFLDVALRYNVQLSCVVLSLPDCLTFVQCNQLGAVLPRLTDLENLHITVSSWIALNVVLRGFNSASQLRALDIYCSPSSPPDSLPGAAVDPLSPPDELLDNISRLSELQRIELRDKDSTLTTENKRDITQRFSNRLPEVRVRIYDKGYIRWESDDSCSDIELGLSGSESDTSQMYDPA